jgi:hypothetical protein
MIDATRDEDARGREYVEAWTAIPDPRFARPVGEVVDADAMARIYHQCGGLIAIIRGTEGLRPTAEACPGCGADVASALMRIDASTGARLHTVNPEIRVVHVRL